MEFISKALGNPRDGSEVLDIGTLQNSETDNHPESLRLLDTCHPQSLLAHLVSVLQPFANLSDVMDENHDIPIPGNDDVGENFSLPPPSPSESSTQHSSANTPQWYSNLSTPPYPHCSPAYSYCSHAQSTYIPPSPVIPSPTHGTSPYRYNDTTVFSNTVVKPDAELSLLQLAHCTLSNTDPIHSQATLQQV